MLKYPLKLSWIFFKNNYNDIASIILPVVIPFEIITGIYKYYFVTDIFVLTEQIFPLSLYFLMLPLYSVPVILYIYSKYSGDIINVHSLFETGLKYWWRYLIVLCLSIILISIGFLILLIPGFILLVRFTYVDFYLVLENKAVIESFNKSFLRTKSHSWLIFKGYAIISICTFIPYYFLTELFRDTYIISIIFNVLLNIIYAVINVFYTIFAFHVYKSSVAGKE